MRRRLKGENQMPIILQDLTQNTAAMKNRHDPKFFSKDFTGNGKKIGLLNEEKNPGKLKSFPDSLPSELKYCKKQKYASGSVTTEIFPISLLPDPDMTHHAYCETPFPDKADLHLLASNNGSSLYARFRIHAISYERDSSKSGADAKKLTVVWTVSFYRVDDAVQKGDSVFYAGAGWSVTNTRVRIDVIMTDLSSDGLNAVWDKMWRMSFPTDIMPEEDKWIAAVDRLSLYEAVCDASDFWQTNRMVQEITAIFRNAKASQSSYEYIPAMLRHLEDYNVPLENYRDIYSELTKHFSADEVRTLCKENLNLLLSDTLSSLETAKPSLTRVAKTLPDTEIDALLKDYSMPQKEIITTEEPLALVQCGAGTGKSTTVLGRINYMLKSGIQPDEIMVLSFTNAAADHINEKCGAVHSMTIARMIHTIYTANFPKQELSNIDTLYNTIGILYGADPKAREFRKKLLRLTKDGNKAFTDMNSFIEENYDAVIDILNTTRQTCLELEIIICYQQIDTLKEPDEVKSRYLIVDEVQDNSIFEFIYTVKYVNKHKESLLIVGDGSQTLYEFRSSNPKALNILEASGVFAAYQLKVNYRSNQEILDMANATLRTIEANQYAQIQLQANSLSPVTADSFKEKVIFHHEQYPSTIRFNQDLDTIIAAKVKPFVDECLKKGEQVAFLAYTRHHVNIMQSALEKMYPGRSIISLVPKKSYNTTIFSVFISTEWSRMRFSPSQSVMNVVVESVKEALPRILRNYDRTKDMAENFLYRWAGEAAPAVAGWQQLYNLNRLTMNDMLKNIRDNMLDFEIRNNAIRQSLLANQNKEQKEQNLQSKADILLSTIHSAKGLEFENTVVVYHDEAGMEEADKRMYYVALTRAMKREYILSYGNRVNPKIGTDYEMIVDALEAKAAAKP